MQRLIGVDVGGTKVSIAVLTGSELSEPQVAPTDEASAEAVLDQLVAGITAAAADGADAVGVAVPASIEWATGTARFAPNLPLRDVPLRDVLRERTGLPVFVDNDATCAALAEAYDGDRVVAGSLVLLTVGTGVGGGIVLDGKVFRGATGAAAELGHLIVGLPLTEGAPPPGEFPQQGSLERLGSGHFGLTPLATAAGFADGPAAVAAAGEGDPRALDILRVVGERLGVGVANVMNTFDPELVVIGGGVSAAGDLLLDPIRATAAQYVLPGVGTKTEIRAARFGNNAGVRGAALMAGQELGA